MKLKQADAIQSRITSVFLFDSSKFWIYQSTVSRKQNGIRNMFRKKDAIRTLFLLMVIIVIVVTLSQILVVHRRNHRKSKPRDSKRLQTAHAMVLRLEKNIEAMMKQNYLPTEKHRNYLLALIYAGRIKQQLNVLSARNHSDVKHKKEREKSSSDSYTAYKDRKLRFLENVETDMTMSEITEPQEQSNINIGVATATTVSDNRKLQQFKKDKRVDYMLSKPVDVSCDRDNDKVHSDGDMNIGSGAQPFSDITRPTRRMGPVKNPKDNHRSFDIQPCQESPDGLVGTLEISQIIAQNDNFLDDRFSDIEPGGIWKPTTCVARQRTAIILPYRNREDHLRTLLFNLLPVLKRQVIEFRIFVVEQHGNQTFNKGRLMNAGFMEAVTMWNFDCVIFHDVDLIPENDRNMYTCGKNPRHMSIAVDKFKYRLLYFTLVGGVFSIRGEQFLSVNGYSNLYWGWGAEDDDMAHRLRTAKLGIERPPATIGRYKMIKHENRETIPVKIRAYLLKTVQKRYHRDGLNTLDYKVISINCTRLYTHILVNVGEPPLEAADINTILS